MSMYPGGPSGIDEADLKWWQFSEIWEHSLWATD